MADIFERNPEAEREVLAFLDNMYSSLNEHEGDSLVPIVDSIAPEMLPIYEVKASPDLVRAGAPTELPATPVKLNNRDEVVGFFTTWLGLVEQAKATQEGSYIGEPLCYATDTMAVFTEDCQVKTIREDGTTLLNPLRGTGVLRKGTDGWKLIHWHISSAQVGIIKS